MTSVLRIAHLRIAHQGAILRWAILRVIYGVQRWMLFKALTVFNAAPTHSPVERFDTRSCSTTQ